jgi:hypothetical protein
VCALLIKVTQERLAIHGLMGSINSVFPLMTNPSRKLDLLLNSLEQTCDSSAYLRARDAFMIDCLWLIEQLMPPIASASFQAARNYHDGLAPLNSVSDALVTCWRELRVGDREMRLDHPEVSAIRAVICLLYSQEHPEADDFLDSISFFLRLLNNVEAHFERQEALLLKHFDSCLKTAPLTPPKSRLPSN